MSRANAVGLVLAASVLWGTTGTAASLLPDDIPGIATGAAAMGVGGVLFLVVFFRRAVRALRDPGARAWILAGGASVLLYPLAFYTGLQQAGVAITTVANIGSAPLFAVVLERVVSGKPLRLRWALGAAAAVTGLVLMTVGTQRPIQDEAGGSTALGLLLALASGLLYATYTFASKRAMRHHRSSTGVMSATFGLGGLMLLPVLAAFGTGLIRSTETLAVSAYLAVVAVFLAYWLFGVALRGIDASTATTVSLVEPVTAALLAVIVVGEHISLIGWLGIGLVLAAIASESASSDR